MKKAVIIVFILHTAVSNAQSIIKHLAYRQVITAYQNKVIKLSYSKKYTHPQQDVFLTNYIVYEKSGKPCVFINASHNKKTQHITIDVEDAQGGVFSHLHNEEYDYEEPTEKYFGISGNYNALGGSKYPYQLSLYFPDERHERINVVITNATDYKLNNSAYVAYIFKDEMLPSKPLIESNTFMMRNSFFQGTKFYRSVGEVSSLYKVTIHNQSFSILEKDTLISGSKIAFAPIEGTIKNGKIYTPFNEEILQDQYVITPNYLYILLPGSNPKKYITCIIQRGISDF
ncbi:hypothetical protein [Mucilaginibacter phyllosphaerae]|uniref:Uncharacterized protein n=1 Tax=Mucilaginibacter phyllosphaerae TaxID=1812349 RepID=A0A4Y8AA21_9SPHI|nr:hypothetical protein [Mucilaginibacter phyllosphaerae]MBB3969904.1 hypothetical protein [Mucilaginibacter phyllosphaerae]TEW65278.1 hypothetical protein E2R65_15310 [Mucilaginibacter phyllosphaerae]GGH16883.1 hypothetical protein GCM10007352_26590 [Mucilaginibacter phyllosphaerae]